MRFAWESVLLLGAACGEAPAYTIDGWLDVQDDFGYTEKPNLKRAIHSIEDAFPELPKSDGLWLDVIPGPFWRGDGSERALVSGGYFQGSGRIRVARELPWECWGVTALGHEIMHWALDARGDPDEKHLGPEWGAVVVWEQEYIAGHCEEHDCVGKVYDEP